VRFHRIIGIAIESNSAFIFSSIPSISSEGEDHKLESQRTIDKTIIGRVE
jgi:hypothetical protein